MDCETFRPASLIRSLTRLEIFFNSLLALSNDSMRNRTYINRATGVPKLNIKKNTIKKYTNPVVVLNSNVIASFCACTRGSRSK